MNEWDEDSGRYICEECGSECETCPGCTDGPAPDQQGMPYCPECDISCCQCGYQFQLRPAEAAKGE